MLWRILAPNQNKFSQRNVFLNHRLFFLYMNISHVYICANCYCNIRKKNFHINIIPIAGHTNLIFGYNSSLLCKLCDMPDFMTDPKIYCKLIHWVKANIWYGLVLSDVFRTADVHTHSNTELHLNTVTLVQYYY